MSKTKKRGFEVISKYIDADIQLPKRATKHSAGYDFYAAEDIVVPSMMKQLKKHTQSNESESKQALTSTLVPTGIKAYMPENEYLMLANRSSNPMKYQLAIPNGMGIIDADYYGNTKNEGEIFLQLINYGFENHTIRKGDRICQGIFMPFLTVDNEEEPIASREGGFGSSGQ